MQAPVRRAGRLAVERQPYRCGGRSGTLHLLESAGGAAGGGTPALSVRRAERDAPPPWVGGWGGWRWNASPTGAARGGLPFFAERQVKFAKGTAYM